MMILWILLTLAARLPHDKPYISVAIDGNDRHDGSFSAPVLTLQRALELSREKGIKRIVVQEGDYFNVSLKLTRNDSGLTVLGETGKRVTLYGGVMLTDWHAENSWFVTDAKGVRNGDWDFRLLLVDDTVRNRARMPAHGFLQHRSEWNYTWLSSQSGWPVKPTPEDLTTLSYRPEDIEPDFDVSNAELTVFHMWDDSYVGVTRNDTIDHELTFSYPATHPAGSFGQEESDEQHRYIVWNTVEGMDHPGQWYLDRTHEKVFYWPKPHEKIENFQAVVPTTNHMIWFEPGVKDVTLKNLNLTCSGAGLSNAGYGSTFIDGAIEGTGVSHVVFDRVKVKNSAGWGIKIKGDYITIVDCEFSDLYAGGISYQGDSVRIMRSGIHDVGRLFNGAVGILGHGQHNLIAHCELYNLPYGGINGVGARSIAEHNLIYNFKQTMFDGGAFYSYGGDSTVYRNNVALNKKGNTISGFTYYFDEQSKDCIVEQNYALNTRIPVLCHMANDITIRDNLFIDDGTQKIHYNKSSALYFTNNTFVADTIIFEGPDGKQTEKAKAEFLPIDQKYLGATGIQEFQTNTLYGDTCYHAILQIGVPVRVEPFRWVSTSSSLPRDLFNVTLPAEFRDAGYRKNAEAIFRSMLINN